MEKDFVNMLGKFLLTDETSSSNLLEIIEKTEEERRNPKEDEDGDEDRDEDKNKGKMRMKMNAKELRMLREKEKKEEKERKFVEMLHGISEIKDSEIEIGGPRMESKKAQFYSDEKLAELIEQGRKKELKEGYFNIQVAVNICIKRGNLDILKLIVQRWIEKHQNESHSCGNGGGGMIVSNQGTLEFCCKEGYTEMFKYLDTFNMMFSSHSYENCLKISKENGREELTKHILEIMDKNGDRGTRGPVGPPGCSMRDILFLYHI